ncbi:hypothetical protein HPP92_011439 [Vanilla planifolia]|uniref:Uncharacterized protein n=1 Tax=Vanilla planifolia TaxID=51239 RepID=A0A835V2D2_VANPL|nr:hypothetical protein HPP92_011439 [Vanilla planifolia]
MAMTPRSLVVEEWEAGDMNEEMLAGNVGREEDEKNAAGGGGGGGRGVGYDGKNGLWLVEVGYFGKLTAGGCAGGQEDDMGKKGRCRTLRSWAQEKIGRVLKKKKKNKFRMCIASLHPKGISEIASEFEQATPLCACASRKVGAATMEQHKGAGLGLLSACKVYRRQAWTLISALKLRLDPVLESAICPRYPPPLLNRR